PLSDVDACATRRSSDRAGCQSRLDDKAGWLRQRFAEFNPPALQIHASEPSHFRLRAEFRLWHEGERCFYAMFEPGNKSKAYEVLDFPIASQLINRLMKELLNAIQPHELLRQKLFQVEFLTTLSGDALITLIYHKPLNDDWIAAAEAMQQQLGF